jgi:hypothetical protein
MAARPDFATDLRAMCKRHYLGTNLAQRAATLNDLQRHDDDGDEGGDEVGALPEEGAPGKQ